MRRSGAALLASLLLLACSKDATPTARAASAKPGASRAKTNDSAAGSVDLGSLGYKPSPLTSVGSISGTVSLDGAAPTATVPIAVDQKVCGTQADNPVEASPKGLADVIVWVADARTGKPLSNDKRRELSSDKCLLDPRVQAVIVGTTVNVFNDDKAIHRLEFIRAASGDTLETMRFFNDGQVVASERLAKIPGIVEVRCAQHPWTRAYIAVFDHPYFAVTEKDGAFRLDSLPPGKYTVNVWHEGMKQPLKQQVQVAANGSAKVDVAVKLQ